MTIEERVAELVAKAPPLTEEERARLRQLLLLVPSHGCASVRTGSKGLIRRRDEAVVTDPVMGSMGLGVEQATAMVRPPAAQDQGTPERIEPQTISLRSTAPSTEVAEVGQHSPSNTDLATA